MSTSELPRRHGSFHPLKDDGVGLTIARISTSRKNMASGTQPPSAARSQGSRPAEKLWLQVLSPRAGEERDSGQGTMGAGLTRSTSVKKKYMAVGPLPPPARIVPSAQGRWGGVNKLDRDANELDMASGCRTSPPRRHGSFHQLKDDGVGLTSSIATPTSSTWRVAVGPLPPRRHGSFHQLKDDGVGLTSSIATPTSSTWRVAVGPLPPAGTDRSISSRTMGWG